MRDRIANITPCQESVGSGTGPVTGSALSLSCEGRAGTGQGGKPPLVYIVTIASNHPFPPL